MAALLDTSGEGDRPEKVMSSETAAHHAERSSHLGSDWSSEIRVESSQHWVVESVQNWVSDHGEIQASLARNWALGKKAMVVGRRLL